MQTYNMYICVRETNTYACTCTCICARACYIHMHINLKNVVHVVHVVWNIIRFVFTNRSIQPRPVGVLIYTRQNNNNNNYDQTKTGIRRKNTQGIKIQWQTKGKNARVCVPVHVQRKVCARVQKNVLKKKRSRISKTIEWRGGGGGWENE